MSTTASTATAADEASTAVGRWVRVCLLHDLAVERGAAALVDGDQIALFRLPDDSVRAVQQRDPYSGANIMSRGIVGTRQGRPTVAAPMYKQVFSLETGACLDPVGYTPLDPAQANLRTFPVRVTDGVVQVGLLDGAAEPAA
ncbi:nitrite reductase small subunit NirD [Occultella glacieicola]|uniref:Nitrite reductase small subunit NirD n=1 Tax=Occultella glacieicola TaxID=2518684 RepID=A0ABY2E7I0_9MICO|nr:nitrite reductase small subunit NirD [Occultella glacieicola]TDE97270.1 nitrite reductase small subunit NirD [Occultella glacieicola]